METGAARHHLTASKHHHISDVRPGVQLQNEVDSFVTQIAMNKIKDDKALNLGGLIKIKDQLGMVIESYERRPEFSIKEQMSARKRELDGLIKTSVDDYAARKKQHDIQSTSLENQLLENHRHVLEVQQQTMIKELKNMNEYLYYYGKIRDQILDIDTSLDALSCCSKLCCFFPSKEIKQKQMKLQLLYDEQDAFASEDHTVVSQILMRKMQESRDELLKQQAELAANHPKEMTQLLLDERAKLKAAIDAERESYYYTVSPAVMLNLIRLQSFLKRTQVSLKNAKSTAQFGGGGIKIGVIDAVLKLVKSFLKKFNELCGDFVCRPPTNPDNTISYAQYCERFQRLQEKERRQIIKGLPDVDDMKYEASKAQMQQLNEGLFYEHVEGASIEALECASSPMLHR